MSQNDINAMGNKEISKEVKKLIIPKNNENDDHADMSYDEYIASQIDVMQRETHLCIKNQLDVIENNYVSFKNNINDFILRKMNIIHQTLNISENNAHIQKYACANITKHISKLFDIHSKMISTLQEHFRIINDFLLQINKHLLKNKPPEEYLISNLFKIYSNSLFSKIDFRQYKLHSFFNADLLDRQVLSYITAHPENKFSQFKLTKDSSITKDPLFESDSNITVDYNKDSTLLQKNKNTLSKLQVIGIRDMSSIFTETSSFPKVTHLDLNICGLKHIPHFNANFPGLMSLSLQNYFPDSNDLDILGSLKMKLQRISLSKMDIITTSFNKIMTLIINNDELRNNVTHLSFADNCISVVDFSAVLFLPKKMHKLMEINFEKNHIYKFSHNPELTPNLKVINMSVNSFGKSYFTQFKKDKTLLLLGNNIYLTNDANNKQYYDILKYQLENFDYNLDYLTLNGIFSKSTRHRLYDIHIHKTIQINVRKLDLSNCSLDDETLIRFFKTNPGFLELRYLRLNDNYLTDNFFQMFIEEQFHLKFPKLKNVLFTSNEIEGEKFGAIRNFIVQNKALMRLVLMKNPMSRRLKVSKKEKGKEEGKVNEFAGILKMVEEINNGERGEDRNYLNFGKSEKGLVIRFDAGEKFSVLNYNVKYSDVELLKSKNNEY